MFPNDYLDLSTKAADRRREMRNAIEAERLLPRSEHPPLHRQAMSKLGDALIRGGNRLKAHADLPEYQLKTEQGGV
jgi:hypothetical protein